MFFDKYSELCKKKGKTPTGVAIELNVSRATVNYWKNGNVPKQDTLIKIAYVLGLQLSIMKKGDFLEFKSYKMMIQDLSISNNVYSKKIMYNTSFPKEYIMNYKGFYNEG